MDRIGLSDDDANALAILLDAAYSYPLVSVTVLAGFGSVLTVMGFTCLILVCKNY